MNAANLIATSMVIIVVDTALASGSAWAFKRLNQSYFRSKSGSGEVQQQSALHGLGKQEFCGSASVAPGSMVHSRLETFLFFAGFDEAPHAVLMVVTAFSCTRISSLARHFCFRPPNFNRNALS
jgi:hypothetical protein